MKRILEKTIIHFLRLIIVLLGALGLHTFLSYDNDTIGLVLLSLGWGFCVLFGFNWWWRRK
jgi:hypothetical protein